MKFLGLKWRFLRSDLEKESLPSLPKRPVPGTEPAAQLTLEQATVLDTYLEALQLKGADDLQSFETVENSEPSVLHAPVAPPAGSCAHSTSGASTSMQSAADQTVASQLTEADVFTALRHMQIFRQHATPQQQQEAGPSTLRTPVTRDKPAASAPTFFTPQPPASGRPSQQPPSRWVGSTCSASSSSGSPWNPSLSRQPRPRPTRRRTKSSAAEDTEAEQRAQKQKVQGLAISRLFRQHALEQGLRVPKCVARAEPL